MTEKANEKKYPCQDDDAWRAFYPCAICDKAEECTGRLSRREWRKGFTQDRFGPSLKWNGQNQANKPPDESLRSGRNPFDLGWG